MSWFEENKFAATLLGATVVVSGALFYLGMEARSEADEAKQSSKNAINRVNGLKAGQPYPDDANRKLVKEKVAAFAADTKSFQDSLLKFRPEKMLKPSPSDFDSSVKDYGKALKAYYTSKEIALSDKIFFGFEAYSSRMADKKAIQKLEYQRKAFDWMFKALADSGISELNNVHRPLMKSETGAAQDKKKNNKKGGNRVVTSVYESMPIEIAFTGDEDAMNAFLATVANSEKYFFALRSVRVKNEKDASPDVKDGEFAAPALSGNTELEDMFEGAEAAGEDAEAAGPVKAGGEETIKQVIGSEKVIVHLKLDLLLFNEADEVKIPGYKKAKSQPETSTK